MRTLSKSKLIAFRQCPKRLWLEVHRPNLREVSPETEARFQVGYQVGDIARRIYDPKGKGALIDSKTEIERWIPSWGELARVLEPVELKRRIRRAARAILAWE